MFAHPLTKRHFLALVCAVQFFATPAVAAQKAARKPKTLKFAEIQQIVERHFSVIPDYKRGDLITQPPVAEIFKQLELYGWKVADQKAILGQVHSDSDFIARQFRSTHGKAFMRQIKQYPGGYDRIDRIAAMPQGRNDVAQMMKLPDGYKMIEAMTTTRRGRILGQRLSNAPKGKDFNKPTGKIYTARALVARLKVSFENRKKK